MIPSHWVKSPLKYMIKKIIDNRGSTPQLEDNGIPYVEVKHIVGNGIYTATQTDRFISEETYNNFIRDYLKSGDILFSTVGTLGRTSIIPEEFYGCIIQNVVGFRPKGNLHGLFLYFLFNSKIEEHLISETNKGNIQGSVKVSDYIQQRVYFPPFKEQQKISNYLLIKTQLIDDLIEKTKQKIELLKEKRTSLINHCVTKGLQPNVEIKDSGLKWLDKIPQHWKIIRLNYLGNLQNGINRDSESFGTGYPFLSYGDVYKNEIIPLKVKGLVSSTETDRIKYSVKEGDVFFTRTSETIEEIGISSVCMRTIENCVFSGFIIRFRNNSKLLTKEYSKFFFSSRLVRVFLINEMDIVTRTSLSQELLKRLPVLIPPYLEQQEIAGYLDSQTQKIDTLIEKENKRIELLKEYRQSLISEAVTGKIDVTGEVAA